MENLQLDQQIRKASVSSGLVFGLVRLVLGIFTFYYITSMTSSIYMISFGPVIFSILLPIVIAIFITLDLRKKIGGYWTFKQATTGIFIMFLVATVISVIGNDFIFSKLIEPQMMEKTQEAVLNASAKMMEKTGMDQAKIDAQTDKIKQQFDEQRNASVGKQITGYVIAIIFAFIFAVIFGAIFKKDPPLFDYLAKEQAI